MFQKFPLYLLKNKKNTASARLGRVYPPISSDSLIQIGAERYVVIDQVGCVDLDNRGAEPAVADQAAPQAIAPDHTYHLGPPPAPDTVQVLADDADVGGRPGDEEMEYAEYTHNSAEFKQEDSKSLLAKSAHVKVEAPATSDAHKPTKD